MSVHGRHIPAVLAAALLLVPLCGAAAQKGAIDDARGLVEKGFADFVSASGAVSRQSASDGGGGPAAVIAETFDLEYFSSRILAETWRGLSVRQRERFRRALSLGLARYVGDFLVEKGTGGTLDYEGSPTSGRLPSGREIAGYLREERLRSGREGEHLMLRYGLESRGRSTPLFFVLAAPPGGPWRITEIFSTGEGVVGEFRARARETLQAYSLPYLEAELDGGGRVVLEDWGEGVEGGLPPRWRWRDGEGRGRKPYALAQEAGARFLAADDRGESVSLGKEVRWNLRKYPYLSFRWRARLLPAGGDERRGGTSDSAAGISVLFDLKMGVVPQTVKYVWSSTLPVGTTVRRKGIGRPWVIVAESGEEHLGEWRSHVFNLFEAYRRTFGREPPEGPIGIGILTDANDTGGRASADYGEIAALESADAGSGIGRFVEPR